MGYEKYARPNRVVNKAISERQQISFRDPILKRKRFLECNGLAIVDGDEENAMTYDTFIYIWFFDSQRKQIGDFKGGEAYDCLEKNSQYVLCVFRRGCVCATTGFLNRMKEGIFMTSLMIDERLTDFPERNKTFKGRMYHVQQITILSLIKPQS